MKRYKLTVILRNDGPMINCEDSPTYRSVQLELTPDQLAKIEPRQTYSSGPSDYFESISKCFIEDCDD